MTLAVKPTTAVSWFEGFQPSTPRALEDFELPGYPSLDFALASLPPLPRQGVLLGIASEGLPVMLNVRDPAPGPLLILGDGGAGKTEFLRFVAAAATRSHRPDQLRFCALTPHPDDWVGFEALPHSLGIVDTADGAAGYALGELAASLHENPGGGAILLLLDDPTSLDTHALDLLGWLLAKGPTARLWPMVTLNSELIPVPPGWVTQFHTRIFGRIARRGSADEFSLAPDAALHNLQAGTQFCTRSEGHWLRFRVPPVLAGG